MNHKEEALAILTDAINTFFNTPSTINRRDNAVFFSEALVSCSNETEWVHTRLLYCLTIEVKNQVISKNLLLKIIGNIEKTKIDSRKTNMHILFAQQIEGKYQNLFARKKRFNFKGYVPARALTFGSLKSLHMEDFSYLSINRPEEIEEIEETALEQKCIPMDTIFWITPENELVRYLDKVANNKAENLCNYLGMYFGVPEKKLVTNDTFFFLLVYPIEFHKMFQCYQPSLLQKNWRYTIDYFFSNKLLGVGLTYNLDGSNDDQAIEQIHYGWLPQKKFNGLDKIQLTSKLIGRVDVLKYYSLPNNNTTFLGHEFKKRN